jgi:glycosyltransferase involved in cell wall biosynthesis
MPKLKVLLIIVECNPEWPSVPLVGYRFYEGLRQRVDVTLVTHQRNQAALVKLHPNDRIVYISESQWIKRYYKIAEKLSTLKGKVIWPLYNTLTYPVYAEFNHRVDRQFRTAIAQSDYDLVHAITPMMPRYPVKVSQVCQNTPFILGPVNGGVPFPKGFQSVARKEFSQLNFLRSLGRLLIPGYRETYQRATHILAGSTYTLDLIQSVLTVEPNRLEWFSENGISHTFLQSESQIRTKLNRDRPWFHLLFVGRLVPYKGADLLLEAIRGLSAPSLAKIQLTLVGDGPERGRLERLAQDFKLKDRVRFTGWVPQSQTVQYYREADCFCFPSVREFGGAVVLEAMAHGLPCLVVNHGGIGEYVTEATGIKVDPVSPAFVVQAFRQTIEQWVQTPDLLQEMALAALQRAQEFTWERKADQVAALYNRILTATPSRLSHPP